MGSGSLSNYTAMLGLSRNGGIEVSHYPSIAM